MTPPIPQNHHRHSIRLKGYDYTSPGIYFVTLVTQRRQSLFGEVFEGEMVLNEFGEIVRDTWLDLVNHNPGVDLDGFNVMPNHFHGILVVPVGAGSEPAPTRNSGKIPIQSESDITPKKPYIPEIIRQFKTFSALRINIKRQSIGTPVWQRNYYEHIIRYEDELNNIRTYIQNNPLNWMEDEENPV